jgi:hypothetical protein
VICLTSCGARWGLELVLSGFMESECCVSSWRMCRRWSEKERFLCKSEDVTEFIRDSIEDKRCWESFYYSFNRNQLTDLIHFPFSPTTCNILTQGWQSWAHLLLLPTNCTHGRYCYISWCFSFGESKYDLKRSFKMQCPKSSTKAQSWNPFAIHALVSQGGDFCL